jgi:adenylosuccinate synthase
MELVKRAAMLNKPTQIALHGTDYLCWHNKGLNIHDLLSANAKSFIESLECSLSLPVSLLGTGPANEEIIDVL